MFLEPVKSVHAYPIAKTNIMIPGDSRNNSRPLRIGKHCPKPSVLRKPSTISLKPHTVQGNILIILPLSSPIHQISQENHRPGLLAHQILPIPPHIPIREDLCEPHGYPPSRVRVFIHDLWVCYYGDLAFAWTVKGP